MHTKRRSQRKCRITITPPVSWIVTAFGVGVGGAVKSSVFRPLCCGGNASITVYRSPVEYSAHIEAATVHCVRRVPTGWGDACARSLPESVVSAAVWICGLRFELRNAVRRLVRSKEGVGAETEGGMVTVVCGRRTRA